MRCIILTLIAGMLAGCASVKHIDPETGLEVTYNGPAHGAVQVVRATDGRAYKLAENAMDHGLNTSLARDADGDVRFSAGRGYSYGTTAYGTQGGNTTYVPGVGLVPFGQPVGALPALIQPVYTPSQSPPPGSVQIVPCPTGRAARTVPEQAACAELTARTAIRAVTN